MLGNTILLSGMAIGIVVLSAMGIKYFIGWMIENPLFIIGGVVGLIIGAVGASFCIIKYKQAEDEELVRKYRVRQAEVISRSIIKNPVGNATNPDNNIDDLVEGLVSMGYGKTESRHVVEQIRQDKPDISDEDAMKESLSVLSGEK